MIALSGGEDYELLFTIDQKEFPKIKGNPNLTVLGHITPECLRDVQGLSPKVAAELAAAVTSELGAQEAMAFLHGLGLGTVQAERVLRRLGPDTESIVRAEDVTSAHRATATLDGVEIELGLELA